MKAQDIKTRPCVAILGEPGTGKTYIIGTLCQLIPTVVITSDLNGIDTLSTMKVDAEVVHITDWTKCWSAFEQVEKALRNGCRGIALDDFGATQAQIRDKAQLMPRGDESRLSIEQRTARIRQSLMQGDRRLLGSQWGEVAVAAESFLREIKGLPSQFLMTTFIEDLRESPRTGLEHIYPALTGQLRYAILAGFSLVADAFKAWDKQHILRYCLTCKEDPRLPTKTRYGEGRTWIDPTAEKLLAHINRREGGSEYAETDVEKAVGTGIP